MATQRCSTVRSGMTLVELVITSAVTLVLALAIGVLLDGGNRAWVRAYSSTFSQKNDEGAAAVSAFCSVGRRSNRTNYILYRVSQGVFTPVQANPSQATSVVVGDAVEFRYWDVELDASDSHDLMEPDKKATAYALFYLDSGQLKVDYGSYPPGAVPTGGGARNTVGVHTSVLAHNVSVDSTAGPFSHTAASGTGQGCVRLNVLLTDPNTGNTTRIMTAALMRNIWPR